MKIYGFIFQIYGLIITAVGLIVSFVALEAIMTGSAIAQDIIGPLSAIPALIIYLIVLALNPIIMVGVFMLALGKIFYNKHYPSRYDDFRGTH